MDSQKPNVAIAGRIRLAKTHKDVRFATGLGILVRSLVSAEPPWVCKAQAMLRRKYSARLKELFQCLGNTSKSLIKTGEIFKWKSYHLIKSQLLEFEFLTGGFSIVFYRS